MYVWSVLHILYLYCIYVCGYIGGDGNKFMYVCVYVCMYICMYVCMYFVDRCSMPWSVFISARPFSWTFSCPFVSSWSTRRAPAQRYVCTVCMYVCMYVLYVCMYVCMYVCTVCMYVCMYCMYVCMYISMYLRIFMYFYVFLDKKPFNLSHAIIWLKICVAMYVCMYVCMYVWMDMCFFYVCMYVCMYNIHDVWDKFVGWRVIQATCHGAPSHVGKRGENGRLAHRYTVCMYIYVFMYVCMYVTSCTHGALGWEVAAMAVAETMHYCTRRLEVRRLRSGGNFKTPACRYMCTYEMYVCICWNEILCMYVYVCTYVCMHEGS